MNLLSHPCRSVAASVALGAFSVGLFASFGAAAIDRHTAVTEVREAAAEVENRRSALAVSVRDAQRVSRQAADLAHEEDVSQAAEALDAAIDEASAIALAAEHTVRRGADDDGAELAAALILEKTTPAGDAATSLPRELSSSPQPSAEATTPAEPSTAAAGAVSGDVDADSEASAAPAGDIDVPKVLDGEIDDPAEARAAAEHLELAQAALDQALEAVEREALALAEITEAAQHAEDLAALEVGAPALDEDIAAAADLIEAVGGKVEDDGAITTVQDALDDASAVIAGLETVDHDTAADVAGAVAQVSGARGEIAAALAGLRSTHEAWVDAENAARTAANEVAVAQNEAAVAQARADYAAANRAAVKTHSNGWRGQPTGVSGSNGRLAAGSLCRLDFASGHSLQCDAAAALEAADDAYHAETGRHLVLTDSYRSYGLQVTTRARKPSTAARPGTSNHGWGMAVDMDFASAAWLAENGADYGWVHPRWARPGGVRPEWWHLEYVATSVGAFEAPEPEGLADLVVSVFPEQTSEDGSESTEAASDED